MAIQLSTLEAAATRYVATFSKSVEQARLAHERTAFLCHSHQDNVLARGLQELLREHGCDLYVDWQDASMPPTPDKTTADKIKKKIEQTDLFLFLATPNSVASRWCPWEIGVADRTKKHEHIFIVPTVDRTGTWYGNEYLQLYRQITDTQSGGIGFFDPGSTSGSLVKALR